MSTVVSDANRFCTRGEQPPVFSLRSRFKAARAPEGEWYEGILSMLALGFSILVPHAHGLGVRFQSFGFGEGLYRRPQMLQSFLRHFLHRDDFQKVRHAETSAVTGNAASGQRMVRPGRVIAE